MNNVKEGVIIGNDEFENMLLSIQSFIQPSERILVLI